MARRILRVVRRLRKLGDPPVIAVQLPLDHLAAVALEQFAQLGVIQIPRIELLDRLTVALAPMLDQVGVEAARPCGPALQKRALEGWEPARDAAEEHRFAQQLARRREMTDVIVFPVRIEGRLPHPMPTEWNVAGTFNSTHFAHTGS